MRKMRFSKFLLGIAAAAFLVIAAIYMLYGPVFFYLAAKTNNIDISYSNIRRAGPGEFKLSNMSVTGRDSGFGIYSEEAVVAPKIRGLDIDRITIAFNMRDARFIRGDREAPSPQDDISLIAATPFQGNRIYKNISGIIETSKEGIGLKDVSADSDDIRLRINGLISKNDIIDADITIEFSSNVTGAMPEELTKVLLADAEDGWKELEIHLAGDISKPSIQVTGKLFRLRISEVSEPASKD